MPFILGEASAYHFQWTARWGYDQEYDPNIQGREWGARTFWESF